jgi:hypothetical protein
MPTFGLVGVECDLVSDPSIVTHDIAQSKRSQLVRSHAREKTREHDSAITLRISVAKADENSGQRSDDKGAKRLTDLHQTGRLPRLWGA